MTLKPVSDWLESVGRYFPKPDSDDGQCTSLAAYQAAGLPMVVACCDCTMTFALTADRKVDPATGNVYCDDCAAELTALEHG